MKKLIIGIIIFFIVLFFTLGLILHFGNIESEEIVPDYTDLQEKIMNNSTWIDLSNEDLNYYILNSTTPTVKKIVNSLEESIPVIFQTSGSKYTNAKDGAFIIASSFTPENNVYIYYYNFSTKKYVKALTTLAELLDVSTSVFICSNSEVLK